MPHVIARKKILSDHCIMEVLSDGDYKDDLIPEYDFSKSCDSEDLRHRKLP